jgi:hypothetical protein
MLQIFEEYYPSSLQRLCNACIYAAGDGHKETLLKLLDELRSISHPEEGVRSPIGAALEKAVLNSRENIIRTLSSLSSMDESSLVRKPTPAEVEQVFLAVLHKKSLTLIQMLLGNGVIPTPDGLKRLIIEARAQELHYIARVISEHCKEEYNATRF